MSLVAELKRRKVFKVGAAYLVVAWLAVQAASIGFPAFEAPAWALRVFILIALLGFPCALVMAWVLDLTPEGLKVETATTGTRRIVAVAVALVVLALGWYFIGQPAVRVGQVAVPAPAPEAATTTPASDKSIAVLPFSDLSPERDQEYFSDGIAEEILNALAQVQDLKVAGRTSSFYFKGRSEKLPAIGAALGVANVLEGSVRKQGNKVRITAQLIRADNGFHLWSQTYDGDLTDVFELQERIARAITDSLKVVLVGEQKARLAGKATENVEAHQEYLRGVYLFNRRGQANLEQSALAFRAAVARDPDYADAWAGLAQTLAILVNYTTETARIDDAQIDAETLAAAERALALKPDNVAALAARAFVRTRRFDWAGAETDYRAAISHDPRNSSARLWYGEYFMNQRRWREAAEQMEMTVELEPLSPINHYCLGWLKDSMGDFAGALPHLDQALRLEPGLYPAMVNKVADLVDLGRYQEAAAAAQQMPEPRRTEYLAVIAAVQDPSLVDAAVAQLQANPLGGTDQPWALMKLGKRELVLEELERQFRERGPYRIWILMIPAFQPLYSEPRFQALVRQMNLPEAAPVLVAATP